MGNGIWAAVSGANSQQMALDVTANNLANASNNGFHADRVVFEESLVRAENRLPATQSIRFAGVGKIVTDFSPGGTVPTARKLDAAIRGDGFFVVKTEAGERYTRLGNLQVAKDGTLTTQSGDALLDTARRPIRLPVGATNVQLTDDGSVRSDAGVAGKLLVVGFAKPSALEHDGETLFRAGGESGTPQARTTTLDIAALEASNYSPVKGMVSMVGITRAFDACERAIDALRDADRKAATSVGSRT